jgi:hypothetical protein
MTCDVTRIRPLLFLLLLALGGAGLIGCHEAVDYQGTITIDPGVAPDTDGRIYLLVRDDVHHLAEHGTGPEGYHIVDPNGGAVPYTSTTGEVEYFYSHYWPPNEAHLGAFIDLNDNKLLDSGEPWGENPDNPLVKPIAHQKGVNTVDIPIDRIYAE